MTLTRKASQAGAVMLVGIVLQLSGFVSGQSVQAPGVSHTILMVLCFGTVGVLTLGFLVSLRFKLNLQTHEVLRQETAKMREAGRTVPEKSRRKPAPRWRCWLVYRTNPCGEQQHWLSQSSQGTGPLGDQRNASPRSALSQSARLGRY